MTVYMFSFLYSKQSPLLGETTGRRTLIFLLKHDMPTLELYVPHTDTTTLVGGGEHGGKVKMTLCGACAKEREMQRACRQNAAAV